MARRGRSSEVERQLPKLNVGGSIPPARSNRNVDKFGVFLIGAVAGMEEALTIARWLGLKLQTGDRLLRRYRTWHRAQFAARASPQSQRPKQPRRRRP